MNSSVSVIRKEKIRSSRTRVTSTLSYTKRSRVSRVRAITDTDTGEEKRTGELPTLHEFFMWVGLGQRMTSLHFRKDLVHILEYNKL